MTPAKIYPFVFLGVGVLFAAWIIFFFLKYAIKNAAGTGTAGHDKTISDEEKMAAISKFASVISHELKNPLSSLKNIAYYLIKTSKNDDPKSKRMMEILSSEVDRVDKMICEFSDISHAARIAKAPANVSNLVEKTLGEYVMPAGIELKKDIEPAIEANVDPERITVVVKNLLKNAAQASGEKGIVLVELKKTGAFFELSVTDIGAGIDSEVLKSIFDPMFTTKTKSLGLGLTVVRETVAGHNGKVEVLTEKGKGSTFKVTVPLSVPPK